MYTMMLALVSSVAVSPAVAVQGTDTVLLAGADSGRTTPAIILEAPPLVSSSGGPRRSQARVGIAAGTDLDTTGREYADSSASQRRRAVEHSDWYYRRLTIHKVASYATIPLFVSEYIVGQKLFDGDGSSNLRSTHQALASGIGVLFGVNTVTGVWNLWESRNDPGGRARRLTHAALMLASDAGFVATASLAPESEGGFEDDSNNRSTHRTVAITSMGVSLASYLMMYVWK